MMLLDEYPPGPAIIVADCESKPVAIIHVGWPDGLIDGLTCFTLSDTARVELVVPAQIRPAHGDGALCPCGNDPNCAGCGGDGIYRGVFDATTVYPLTPQGAEDCVAFGAERKQLEVLNGFVPRCFAVALKHRAKGPGIPVRVVLSAMEELGYQIDRF